MRLGLPLGLLLCAMLELSCLRLTPSSATDGGPGDGATADCDISDLPVEMSTPRDSAPEQRLDGLPSDGRADVPQPDAPVEVGTYGFDFETGDLSAWTTVTNSWQIVQGVLSPTAVGFSGLRLPIVLDRSQGALEMRARLPVLDCRGAYFRLLDQNATRLLSFGIDHCVDFGSGSSTPFFFGAGSDGGVASADGGAGPSDGGPPPEFPWSSDTSWHHVRVVFAGGSYSFFLDGKLRATKLGPVRLRAAFLELGGWVHAVPGTQYDDVSIGP